MILLPLHCWIWCCSMISFSSCVMFVLYCRVRWTWHWFMLTSIFYATSLMHPGHHRADASQVILVHLIPFSDLVFPHNHLLYAHRHADCPAVFITAEHKHSFTNHPTYFQKCSHTLWTNTKVWSLIFMGVLPSDHWWCFELQATKTEWCVMQRRL